MTDIRAINHDMYDTFIRRVHSLRQRPAYSAQIRSCIEHIDMHLYDPVSLPQLARRVGYSDYYLSRRFKEETGTSIGTYIRTARLERAASDLVSTDLPVSRIADRLQFCSASYFSSCFRKHFGVLPQEYRKEHLRL